MKPSNITFSDIKTKTQKSLISLLAIAFCSALPSHLLALGLGEISGSSKLGEPLNAYIVLNNVGDLTDEELKVDLGDTKHYARLGIDRPHSHRQLHFNLDRTEQGQTQIQVTTKERMDEPFLDFVIQIKWPNGMLVKEFRVLLDPPDPS